MSSSEWRSAGSLLRWCQATLFVATSPMLAACEWRSASNASSVEILEEAAAAHGGADLDLDDCRAYCRAFDIGGKDSIGVEPRPSPVSGCHLATLAIARETSDPETSTAGPSVLAPTFGSTVLICDYHWAGHFSMPAPGTPYGRPVPRLARFRGAPRTAREHFYRAAYYEAASVVAFEQPIIDLQSLGAPAELVRAAERAREDESIHTRLSLEVSRSLDGPPPPRWPRLPRARRRAVPVLDLALENAHAGCVNETFGVWLQLHQAARAHDPRLRDVARRIARDEARHAALSFRIFDWLDQKLDAAGRCLVRSRLVDATRIVHEVAEPPPSVIAGVGLPGCAQMARAASMLRDALPLVCEGLA